MPRPVKFKIGDKINMLTILGKSHVRVVSEKKSVTVWRCGESQRGGGNFVLWRIKAGGI